LLAGASPKDLPRYPISRWRALPRDKKPREEFARYHDVKWNVVGSACAIIEKYRGALPTEIRDIMRAFLKTYSEVRDLLRMRATPSHQQLRTLLLLYATLKQRASGGDIAERIKREKGKDLERFIAEMKDFALGREDIFLSLFSEALFFIMKRESPDALIEFLAPDEFVAASKFWEEFAQSFLWATVISAVADKEVNYDGILWDLFNRSNFPIFQRVRKAYVSAREEGLKSLLAEVLGFCAAKPIREKYEQARAMLEKFIPPRFL
jgi:hypothetical protein